LPTVESPSIESPHARSVEEVAGALGVDLAAGLTEEESAARLARFGRNELARAAPIPAWRRFLAQFRDLLVVLLLAAAAISAILWLLERETRLPYEALAILAIVIANASLGFVQEGRAEAAIAALEALSADDAQVVRGGERRRVPAAEVVPGDLLLLEAGDAVPADARLVEATALRVSEAALTGESLPVDKATAPVVAPGGARVPLGDRHDMVWRGTAVAYGRGRALVTATGMATEMGRIAGLLGGAEEGPTPLQRELDRVGRRLGAAVVAIAAVMIATLVVVEQVRSTAALLDALILGVALAVAAVPEGLLAVVTVVLALGVQRLARRRAIVRRLAAVETLGSASVVASDKTGTLTRNEMTVRVVETASGRVRFEGTGYAPRGEVSREGGGAVSGDLRRELEHALAAADLASNATLIERDGAWMVDGDPTEGALIVAARKAGLEPEALDARLPRVGEVPFSSERKLMSTVHRDADGDGRWIVFSKGAPDVLLERCSHELRGDAPRPLTPARRREILAANDALADRALRTLGVALHRLRRAGVPAEEEAIGPEVERELVFAGLIGMFDPPREGAAEAVARARGAGIRPLLITGDHSRTAAVIARELGVSEGGPVVTGAELERLGAEELERIVAERSVYARVDPEHKLRIVEALRRRGATVAMTGDGVNDAPALRRADIGVAMGIAGTDVSREAADLVLADDDFSTLVAAVETGRSIFANIRKFLRFLLSSNTGEVATMFLGVLLAERLGLPGGEGAVVLPLAATQVLWINLVTDGAPALALGVDPPEPGLMLQPPRPRGEPVIPWAMWRGIVGVGVVMAAATLGVLDAALPGGWIAGTGSFPYAQTMAFTTLVLAQLFNVFNARSGEASALEGAFANGWLWGAVALSLLLQAAVLYLPPLQRAFATVPLAPRDLLLCLAAASTVLLFREGWKALARLLR